ncbi:peptidoglycan-binding protein [Myxococcota bacterium]|nr:peptidoglycan-binding protein [Myxococcota bacterium]MBU1899157.1 peptidoglycan-binding protein [Myxococcota bacterium]
MIRLGDRGESVRRLQRGLEVAADGVFGPATEKALRALQAEAGLKVDGIYGRASWEALLKRVTRQGRLREVWPWRGLRRLTLGARTQAWVARGASYNSIQIRGDFAEALGEALGELEDAGCAVTTSGSRRALDAQVSRSRSATSMHYIGRAFDLGVATGAQDPARDAFLVAEDAQLREARRWRVFARVGDNHAAHPLVEKRRLRALSAKVRGLVEVEALVVDVTARLEQAGFVGIGARSASWAAPFQRYPGTEWWHFQTVEGLEAGRSTFGDELLTVFDLDALRGKAPWALRGEVFGEKFN